MLTYSRMSISPACGHGAPTPRVKNAGHTPHPYGKCVYLMAVRKCFHDRCVAIFAVWRLYLYWGLTDPARKIACEGYAAATPAAKARSLLRYSGEPWFESTVRKVQPLKNSFPCAAQSNLYGPVDPELESPAPVARFVVVAVVGANCRHFSAKSPQQLLNFTQSALHWQRKPAQYRSRQPYTRQLPFHSDPSNEAAASPCTADSAAATIWAPRRCNAWRAQAAPESPPSEEHSSSSSASASDKGKAIPASPTFVATAKTMATQDRGAMCARRLDPLV
mmetsp:Transcript_80399/g.232209  ORF Transcript_80399/g.232209 Transcript_80399/m.232209 type:complete len:277 (-) Transcript_80399:37-867(-)